MQPAARSVGAVHYVIRPAAPQAHCFEVTCVVIDPDPAGQCFAMPAWIPGSYMIREFARHVTKISAASGKRPLRIKKLDKHTWQAAPTTGSLSVTIEVYAFDTSVRGAYLDTTRGFFNGPCVFLRVLGQEDRACIVDIRPPVGARYRNWQVGTAMSRLDVSLHGFGSYQAADYDELIDHPVELSHFTRATFRAHGVAHDIIIAGRHSADMRRLSADLKRICEVQIDLFGKPAPVDRYVFLVNALGEGYGGLEHRASTALLCSRDDLPRAPIKGSDQSLTDGYRTFLGLASHEYFHTWNVKRIKPAAFAPYDLDQENYTQLLWAFEGFTSYYDDLTLVRGGLISTEDYLGIIAKSATSLARTPGRLRQTVAESSFDAWIKYYRQDENTPNTVVSYYGKGSLIALCLDLLIRRETRGRRSLDDLMRLAWRRHGRRGLGLPENGIEQLASEIVGRRAARTLEAFFRRSVYGTVELPLAEMLATVGIDVRERASRGSEDRGGFLRRPSFERAAAAVDAGWRLGVGTEAKVLNVFSGGAAEAAAIAPGDWVIAADGLRVSGKALSQRIAQTPSGTPIALHMFRRDELYVTTLTPRRAAADTIELGFKGSAATPALRRWLGPK